MFIICCCNYNKTTHYYLLHHHIFEVFAVLHALAQSNLAYQIAKIMARLCCICNGCCNEHHRPSLWCKIHKAIVISWKMAVLDQKNVNGKSRTAMRKRKKYLLRRSHELSFEIFCLISGKRIAYLYDHGAFTKYELASLLASLSVLKVLKVLSVSDKLELGSDTMDHNESIFLVNVKCLDTWIKEYPLSMALPIFVNISSNLKPKQIII